MILLPLRSLDLEIRFPLKCFVFNISRTIQISMVAKDQSSCCTFSRDFFSGGGGRKEGEISSLAMISSKTNYLFSNPYLGELIHVIQYSFVIRSTLI